MGHTERMDDAHDRRFVAEPVGTRETALLILGAHRSGTSVLTRALGLLGYKLPATLLGPNKSNPHGHWESRAINIFNDELLAAAGTRWSHIDSIAPEWHRAPQHSWLMDAAQKLLHSEYRPSSNFVIKDPRMCRLMPFWLDALDRFGSDIRIVSIVRHPGEVAASLATRNNFDPVLGELIWLRNVLDAEADTRHRPRVHLTFTRLLDNWRRAIETVLDGLGLPIPSLTGDNATSVERFLALGTRHETNTRPALSGTAARWVADVHDIFVRWAETGEDSADHKTLDRTRRALDATLARVGTPLKIGFEASVRLGKVLKLRDETLERTKSVERALADERESRVELTEQLERTTRKLAGLRDKVRSGDDELAALRKALAESAALITELRARQARSDQRESIAVGLEVAAAVAGAERDHTLILLAQAQRERDDAQADIAAARDRIAANDVMLARAMEATNVAIAERALIAAQAETALHDRDVLADQLDTVRRNIVDRERELAETRHRLAAAEHDRDRMIERGGLLARTEARADHFEAVSQKAEARIAALQRRVDRTMMLVGALRSSRSRDRTDLRTLYEIRAERDSAAAEALAARTEQVDRLVAEIKRIETARIRAERYPDLERPLERELVDASGLFDADWYRIRYPDVAASGIDPIDHFLDYAAHEERDPSPRFSTRGYHAENPDVRDGGLNPLLHYLRWGRAEGRSIVTDDQLLMRESPLFDVDWYRLTYPDVAHMPAPELHYLEYGSAEGRDPGPYFSTSGYLDANPDVRDSGQGALLHYLRYGAQEGRRIVSPDEWAVRTSALFDADWYRATYSELAETGEDPVLHYLRCGNTDRRDPGPNFSTAGYLADNQDVATSETNALAHYLRCGVAEGRPIVTPDQQLLRSSDLFSARWYLKAYPVVRKLGIDPALHYIAEGAAQNRDPSLAFSTVGYLERYPDVAAASIPALLHYLRHGQAEGRLAVSPQMAQAFREAAELRASPLLDTAWYLEAYPDVAATGIDPAEHYIRYGAAEGRDPGPGFSTRAYLILHPDVAGIGMNPLLHWIRHGASEGRAAPSVDEAPPLLAVDAVRTSPLFDADWYLAMYPDARAAGGDPAGYYLAHGSPAGHDPGPGFSVAGYRRLHPDLPDETAPLLHHITVGIPRGDKPVTRAEEARFNLIEAIAAHPLFDAEWYRRQYPADLPETIDLAAHYYEIGGPEGIDPGPDFKAQWYLRVNGDVSAGNQVGFLHYLNYGEAEGRAIAPARPTLADMLMPAVHRRAADKLYGETGEIVTATQPISLVTERTALWLGDTVIGYAREDGQGQGAIDLFALLHGWGDAQPARAIAEDDLFGAPVGDRRISDAWLGSDTILRIRLDPTDRESSTATQAVRVFQVAGEQPILCGEATIAGHGPRFVTARLRSPYHPVLVVLTDAGGVLDRTELLAFPSLLRGGAHHAEGFAADGVSTFAAIRELSAQAVSGLLALRAGVAPFVRTLRVDTCNARGGEKLLSAMAQAWLADIVCVEVALDAPFAKPTTPVPVAADVRAWRTQSGTTDLALPAAALPTIAVLSASADIAQLAADAAGSFLVADATSARGLLDVALPTASTAALDRVQPVGTALPFPWLSPHAVSGSADLGDRCAPRSAILFRGQQHGDATLLFRVSSEVPGPVLRTAAVPGRSITVELRAISNATATKAALRSLASQNGADALRIRLTIDAVETIDIASIHTTGEMLFPGRFTIADDAQDDADALLFLTDRILLHDRRTIETLAAMIAVPDVASASCLLLSETGTRSTITVQSAALRPVARRRHASDGWLLPAFPHATYPAELSGHGLMLVPGTAWREWSHGVDGFDAQRKSFAERAAEAGKRHLTTSAVTAMVDADPDDRGRTLNAIPSLLAARVRELAS